MSDVWLWRLCVLLSVVVVGAFVMVLLWAGAATEPPTREVPDEIMQSL